MKIKEFFDTKTSTLTYLVYDPLEAQAVIIDPVLNYNQASGKYSYESAKQLLAFVKEKELHVSYVLETHAHADHISSALYLKENLKDLRIGISESIKKVQTTFKEIYNLKALAVDGSQFDHLLKDEEELRVGNLRVKVLFTPGHTPACVSYLINDTLFVGDVLFMPDLGTGRCDFPGGDAAKLFDSVKNRLYQLPEETRVFVGHDYPPKNRDLAFETSIKDSKHKNIRLNKDTSKDEFVSLRRQRDSELNAPSLLLAALQININGGQLPEAEDNGVRYLKIPIFPVGSQDLKNHQ